MKQDKSKRPVSRDGLSIPPVRRHLQSRQLPPPEEILKASPDDPDKVLPTELPISLGESEYIAPRDGSTPPPVRRYLQSRRLPPSEEILNPSVGPRAALPLVLASVMAFALCLANCPFGKRSPGWGKYELEDVYPTVVEQVEKYRPVYIEAEEDDWMEAPGIPLIFDDFESSPYRFRIEKYEYCMDAALKGNPRGMACLCQILQKYPGAKGGEPQKKQTDALAKARSAEYWCGLAERYMPGGWVWNRVGDLDNRSRCGSYRKAYAQGNAEAGFLLEKHRCSTVEKVLESARKGDYRAMGLLAESLAHGGRVGLEEKDADLAREYALRSAYACTEEGTEILRRFYTDSNRRIEAGLPADKFMVSLISMEYWRIVSRRRMEKNPATVNALFPPEQREMARASHALLASQCERAKEDVLRKHRPKWRALTWEMREELAPFIRTWESPSARIPVVPDPRKDILFRVFGISGSLLP